MTNDAAFPVGWSEPPVSKDDLDTRLAVVKRRAAELTPIHDDHDLEDAIDDASAVIAESVRRRHPQFRNTADVAAEPPFSPGIE